MKNKKLIFTIIGIVILILFMVVYLVWGFLNTKIDAVVVTAWLTNLMLLISVYNQANVAQKKIISEKYRPELDEKLKG